VGSRGWAASEYGGGVEPRLVLSDAGSDSAEALIFPPWPNILAPHGHQRAPTRGWNGGRVDIVWHKTKRYCSPPPRSARSSGSSDSVGSECPAEAPKIRCHRYISRRAFRTMLIVPVATPALQFPRPAAYRFFCGPIQSVYNRQDCARGDRILPRGVAPMRCPIYVVAVPGVGPFVPLNAYFFDVVIGFDDY